MSFFPRGSDVAEEGAELAEDWLAEGVDDAWLEAEDWSGHAESDMAAVSCPDRPGAAPGRDAATSCANEATAKPRSRRFAVLPNRGLFFCHCCIIGLAFPPLRLSSLFTTMRSPAWGLSASEDNPALAVLQPDV
jgi:hypothetical protein